MSCALPLCALTVASLPCECRSACWRQVPLQASAYQAALTGLLASHLRAALQAPCQLLTCPVKDCRYVDDPAAITRALQALLPVLDSFIHQFGSSAQASEQVQSAYITTHV